jgi:hypothetical protein
MPCFVLLVLIVAKIHLKDKAPVAGSKQSSKADKAGRLRGQLGLSVFKYPLPSLALSSEFFTNQYTLSNLLF